MACIPFQSTLSLRRATGQPMCPVRLFDHFNPRSPCGERPDSFWGLLRFIQFQSTLSLRRATRSHTSVPLQPLISIHALLAESDAGWADWPVRARDFNPRSPCGERRCPDKAALLASAHFNPRSPCGERPHWKRRCLYPLRISIHALLAESDYNAGIICTGQAAFQSTLSLRRATANTTKLALSFLSKVPI